MPRLYKKAKKVALAPGTLIEQAQKEPMSITLIEYDKNGLKQVDIERIEDIFPCKKSSEFSWINIHSPDIDAMHKIGEHFDIHPLVLEDIANKGQRPKMEDYGSYLFFVLKMIHFVEDEQDIYAEQLSLILGKNYLISFQEKKGDVFDFVRKRIKDSNGRLRQRTMDYLAYALIDAVVDHYFVILEKLGTHMDDVEEELLSNFDEKIMVEIHALKRQIIYLRKHVWPLREVIAGYRHHESKLIHKETEVYLQDVQDHVVQVNDTLEAFREAISSLHDVYLTYSGNKMNEIMKVLTIFAAIFIPLTFMAGIYGMNFEYIPELKWKYGYFMLLGSMLFVTLGMLIFFKKKKWL